MKLGILLALLLRIISIGAIYPLGGTVVEVETETNLVIFETAGGNQFAFEETDDWCIGDRVATIMYDNETPYDVRDDIILSVRYVG